MRCPPPWRKESSSKTHCRMAGSAPSTTSGTTNTVSRSMRSPFPNLPWRYARSVSAAKTMAAIRPAVRSGVSSTEGLPGRLAHGGGRPPRRGRRDDVGDHTVLEPLDHDERRLDEVFREQRRLEAERRQLGVDGVVVVLLRLDAGVRHVVHAHVHPVVLAC